eukprot:3966914-Alexandrium_andersonii.AAC.1
MNEVACRLTRSRPPPAVPREAGQALLGGIERGQSCARAALSLREIASGYMLSKVACLWKPLLLQ